MLLMRMANQLKASGRWHLKIKTLTDLDACERHTDRKQIDWDGMREAAPLAGTCWSCCGEYPGAHIAMQNNWFERLEKTQLKGGTHFWIPPWTFLGEANRGPLFKYVCVFPEKKLEQMLCRGKQSAKQWSCTKENTKVKTRCEQCGAQHCTHSGENKMLISQPGLKLKGCKKVTRL